MWVYLYPNNTETELKNAYIGEYRVPWADTLLYLKFNNNLNDDSGNNVSVTGAWIWYGAIWDNHYAEMTGAWSWTYITPPASLWSQIWTWDFAVSMWFYPVTTSRWGSCLFMCWNQAVWTYVWIHMNYGNDTGKPRFSTTESNIDVNMPANQRMYVCFTRVNWVASWYINWELKGAYNSTINITNTDNFFILNRNTDQYQQWSQAWAKVSEAIFEKRWWTAADVVNYYNNTKANYWIV